MSDRPMGRIEGYGSLCGHRSQGSALPPATGLARAPVGDRGRVSIERRVLSGGHSASSLFTITSCSGTQRGLQL